MAIVIVISEDALNQLGDNGVLSSNLLGSEIFVRDLGSAYDEYILPELYLSEADKVEIGYYDAMARLDASERSAPGYSESASAAPMKIRWS